MSNEITYWAQKASETCSLIHSDHRDDEQELIQRIWDMANRLDSLHLISDMTKTPQK